jgi:hypothetical protein
MINKLSVCAVFALVLGTASTGFAATVAGKVTFLGTVTESAVNGVYAPQFRIRVSGSSCDGGNVQDRWIVVNGGRSDGVYSHNDTNTRNAYSTLVAAFLSGKTTQIDSGNIVCNSTATQFINLYSSQIGVY